MWKIEKSVDAWKKELTYLYDVDKTRVWIWMFEYRRRLQKQETADDSVSHLLNSKCFFSLVVYQKVSHYHKSFSFGTYKNKSNNKIKSKQFFQIMKKFFNPIEHLCFDIIINESLLFFEFDRFITRNESHFIIRKYSFTCQASWILPAHAYIFVFFFSLMFCLNRFIFVAVYAKCFKKYIRTMNL